MSRVLRAFLSLMILAATTSAVSVGIVAGSASPAAAALTTDADMVSEIVAAHNAERAARGLAPLALSSNPRAQEVTEANHRDGQLSHAHFAANGISWFPGASLAGENLASSSSGYTGNLMSLWMGSSAHRKNVLDPAFSHMSVGIVCDGDRVWAAVHFQRIGGAPASALTAAPPATPQVSQPYTGEKCGAGTPDCEVLRLTDAPSFVTGSQHQDARSMFRLYLAYFDRFPDGSGFQYWLDTLEAEHLFDVSQFFTYSPEFQQRYGSLTNYQFIGLVYQNVLCRTPDSGGLNYWLDQLNAGTVTWGELMVYFSDAPEFRAATFSV